MGDETADDVSQEEFFLNNSKSDTIPNSLDGLRVTDIMLASKLL